MKTIEISLLLYSLLFSVFLAATAALEIQNSANPAFIILMLPLVGFFLMELKRATRSSSAESAFSAKKLLGFLLLLVILIIASSSSFAYNKMASNSRSDTAESPIIISSQENEMVVIGTVEIIGEEGSPIPVFKDKDTQSEILLSANVGDVYEYVQHVDSWVIILINDNQIGHIKEINTATIIQ